MVADILFKLGVPTYQYSINTLLQGGAVQKIGDTLEVTVGWIYGLATQVSGTLPLDPAQPLPTGAQIQNIYLNLKYGQSIYINQMRMSDLTFIDPAAGLYINQSRYLPVNIPALTDFKQSFYQNPQLYNNINVSLTLYYIDKVAYKNLVESGLMFVNAQKFAPQMVKGQQ